MRAHFVPAAYLKAFSDNPSKGRRAEIKVIERDRERIDIVENVCVCSDYYSRFPSTDAALFQDQEKALSRIATVETVPSNLAQLLWGLKLRNRSILDFSRYRQLLITATNKVDLGKHMAWFADVEDSSERFITTDDPVIIYSGNDPKEYCFLLPVSTTRLAISAPKNLYRQNGTLATLNDVRLINRLLCKQVRRTVLLPTSATVPEYVRESIPLSPTESRSEVLQGPIRFSILNFVGPNPRAPGQLPSFISLKDE